MQKQSTEVPSGVSYLEAAAFAAASARSHKACGSTFWRPRLGRKTFQATQHGIQRLSKVAHTRAYIWPLLHAPRCAAPVNIGCGRALVGSWAFEHCSFRCHAQHVPATTSAKQLLNGVLGEEAFTPPKRTGKAKASGSSRKWKAGCWPGERKAGRRPGKLTLPGRLEAKRPRNARALSLSHTCTTKQHLISTLAAPHSR